MESIIQCVCVLCLQGDLQASRASGAGWRDAGTDPQVALQRDGMSYINPPQTLTSVSLHPFVH